MKPLVSIIIPNYNGEKFIESCINSAINQTYDNIELIFVDDGSADTSMDKINQMEISETKMIVYQQQNLNASIARNKGIELAHGEYFLFLDSDDILYPDAIACLVEEAISTNADLVIGNYNTIDIDNIIIQECHVTNGKIVSKQPMDFVGIVPAPSNKLYSKRIIQKNKLAWGNVRIGQDLNFFLKYLACCDTITTTGEFIYGWRFVNGSMSNSFNFRIFDIAESFRDIKNFYIRNGKETLYDEYLAVVEYRHYYLQMEKQKYFKSRKARKLVVAYFMLMLEQIDLSKCRILDWYKSDLLKCKYKIRFDFLYISRLYAWLDLKFARR